jgi:hypothetical protein
MRRLTWTCLLVALSTVALGAETAPRPKHKRLHWLRRIGSAEVALAERVSSIRLHGSPDANNAHSESANSFKHTKN